MAKEYEVLTITELLRSGDRGGIEKFYRHTIKTRGGTVLTVDVDERNFTAAKAAPVLATAAIEADKIKAL